MKASPENRLNYVIKNFLIIYSIPGGQSINIGYGENKSDKLNIPDQSVGFFEAYQQAIHPETIVWKEVSDVQIPFIFNQGNSEDVFTFSRGDVVFNFDIISAIFYFLSGWQEYNSPEKDDLDRYNYNASIQSRLNIIQLPVVSYYFYLLKVGLEKAYGIVLINKFTQKSPFHTAVTHDVDVWERLWLKEGKTKILNRNLKEAFQVLWSKVNGKYLEKSLAPIKYLQNKYQFKSTFFFLTNDKPYLNYANADYKIQKEKYRKVIRHLASEGNQIGLHGSFSTSYNVENLIEDKKNLPQNCTTNRFHYLIFSSEKTVSILKQARFKYDSSLGFNSMPGFRNGTSYPFYLYDFEKGESTDVLEIPLIIMDVSMFYKHYLHCNTAIKAFTIVLPILNQIKKMGGCLAVNWHNDSFVIFNRKEWIRLLEMILEFSVINKSIFCTLDQVYNGH